MTLFYRWRPQSSRGCAAYPGQTWNVKPVHWVWKLLLYSQWIFLSTFLMIWSWWPSIATEASVHSTHLLTLPSAIYKWSRDTRPLQAAHKGNSPCVAAQSLFCHHFQRVQHPSWQSILPPSPWISTNPIALLQILPNLKIHTVHMHRTHRILETLYCSEEFLKVSPSTATVHKEKLANIHNSTNIW